LTHSESCHPRSLNPPKPPPPPPPPNPPPPPPDPPPPPTPPPTPHQHPHPPAPPAAKNRFKPNDNWNNRHNAKTLENSQVGWMKETQL